MGWQDAPTIDAPAAPAPAAPAAALGGKPRGWASAPELSSTAGGGWQSAPEVAAPAQPATPRPAATAGVGTVAPSGDPSGFQGAVNAYSSSVGQIIPNLLRASTSRPARYLSAVASGGLTEAARAAGITPSDQSVNQFAEQAAKDAQIANPYNPDSVGGFVGETVGSLARFAPAVVNPALAPVALGIAGAETAGSQYIDIDRRRNAGQQIGQNAADINALANAGVEVGTEMLGLKFLGKAGKAGANIAKRAFGKGIQEAGAAVVGGFGEEALAQAGQNLVNKATINQPGEGSITDGVLRAGLQGAAGAGIVAGTGAAVNAPIQRERGRRFKQLQEYRKRLQSKGKDTARVDAQIQQIQAEEAKIDEVDARLSQQQPAYQQAPEVQPNAQQPAAQPVQQQAAPDFIPDQPTQQVQPAAIRYTAAPEVNRKPAYDMSQDELDRQIDLEQNFDRNLLKRLFGDKADRYRSLQRRANSLTATHEQTNAASEEIQTMEDALTEDQRNELFGINQPERPDIDHLKDISAAIGDVDIDTPESMGASLQYAITDIDDATDPAKMTRKQQIAYAQLRYANEKMRELGFDEAQVVEAAIKASHARFSDPADAEFMLSRWLRKADAPDLKRPQVERPRPQITVNQPGASNDAQANPQAGQGGDGGAPGDGGIGTAQVDVPGVRGETGIQAGGQPIRGEAEQDQRAAGGDPAAGSAAQGVKEPWEMTVAESRKAIGAKTWNQKRGLDFKKMHRAAVEKAVKEGKPVPQEVLADYPDLAKQAFQQAWNKAYGNKPQTEKAKINRKPFIETPELTREEAQKVAAMSDDELAAYNAKQAQPQKEPEYPDTPIEKTTVEEKVAHQDKEIARLESSIEALKAKQKASGDLSLLKTINNKKRALSTAHSLRARYLSQLTSQTQKGASNVQEEAAQAEVLNNAPPPSPEAAGGGFDSEAFNNERDDRIKASREAGNVHLDKIPPYVESMRGKKIFSVHDPKVTGTIRTVDNRGSVYVDWSDKYSAEKETASPVKEKRRTVMRSSLGPTDLKDYAVAPQRTPPPSAEVAGREWKDGDGRTRKVVGPAPGRPDGFMLVQTEGERTAQIIHRQDIPSEIERDQKNFEYRSKQREKESETKKAEAAAQAEREDIDGFAADKTEIERKRAIAVLNKQVSVNGKAMTRKARIKQAIANGAVIRTENGQDRFYQFDGRIPKSDGTFQENVEYFTDLTKIELEYAKHLIKSKKASRQEVAGRGETVEAAPPQPQPQENNEPENADRTGTGEAKRETMLSKADSGRILARSAPRERYDVDKGSAYTEYRVRNLTQGERDEVYRRTGKPYSHVVESRIINVDGEKHSVRQDWGHATYGNSPMEAIDEYIGDTQFAESETSDPRMAFANRRRTAINELSNAIAEAETRLGDDDFAKLTRLQEEYNEQFRRDLESRRKELRKRKIPDDEKRSIEQRLKSEYEAEFARLQKLIEQGNKVKASLKKSESVKRSESLFDRAAALLGKPPKGFRGGYVRFGRTGAEDIDPYDDPEIERRDRENKGMKRPTILARVMDTAGKWYREATRSHEHLDVSKKPDAEMDNILRIREAKIAGAAGKAYRLMRDFVGDLNPKQYDRFRRLLILDDLAKDVEQGKYEDRFDSVPFFGKPGDTKQAILDRIKSQKERYEARLDDATRKAVKSRNAEVRKLTEYMVELNILPESVLSDDRYYHRQVTEYLNMREYATTGGKGPDAKMYKRGFQKQRTGGGDFNSAYEQSEHEYLTHALRQIATAEAHNEIRQFNIGKQLRDDAKEKNLIAAFGGKENYYEFRSLKDAKAEIIAQIKAGEADKSELRDWNNEHGDRLDELWVTRGEDTQIAKAIEEMYKTSGATTDLESDTGDVWGVEDGELADLPPAQLAQRILNEGTKTFSPEAVASANWFFKALSDKRAKIRQLAGKQFVEWKDLIPEDYTLWSPKAGTQFARILSIPESIVQQIVESNREFDESMLREMFARVPGEQLVIPKNFADQLDTPTTNTNETAAGAAARYINGKWKQYILLNPAKAVKYNLNNFSGDLDAVIAADPGILKHSKQAAADLISFMQGKATPAVRAEIERAMELGVTNSGEALNEIPDVSGTATFKKLTGGNPNPVKWYWDTVGNASTLRENVFRLAAYRRAMEKIKAGNKFYWASNRNRVNAVGDPQQKAAMLARDLLGDYGNISVFGQWMRQKAVPFWSWMEINLPRYVRLFRNSVHDGTGGRFAGAMALKTAKAPVTLAARAALSPVKTTMLASALYGAIAAWNAMMFPGEDDGIEDGRLRLLLGKNADGKMMSIRFQGAFSDALAWFGLEDAAGKIARVQRGEASVKDEVIKSAKAPVNKLVNSMLPIPKTIGEAAVGKTTFPDVFNPRNIRDSAEHLAGLVDLDTPYRWLKSIPQRGSAFDLIGNTADPEEQAYQRTKSVAAKYKEKLGKGSDPGDPTPRSDALYYYRKARVMGDDVKARYWLNEYKRLGGTPDGLRRSIESANPRRFIAQGDVRGFWDSLSPQQRQDFRRAEKFYKRVYQPR